MILYAARCMLPFFPLVIIFHPCAVLYNCCRALRFRLYSVRLSFPFPVFCSGFVRVLLYCSCADSSEHYRQRVRLPVNTYTCTHTYTSIHTCTYTYTHTAYRGGRAKSNILYPSGMYIYIRGSVARVPARKILC